MGMKLGEWLEIWLEKYVRPSVKRHTLECYRGICRKHILPALGHWELDELTAPRLQDFMLGELEHGNRITGGHLSVNTVYGEVSVLRLALREAVALGMAEREHTDRIRLPHPEEREIRVLGREEQRRLEHCCLCSARPRDFGIVLCLYTGIRLGELLALTWEDIDLRAGILRVNKTLYTVTGNGREERVVDAPKTRASRRSIPLPAPLADRLRAQRQTAAAPYLIATRTGDMVSPRAYQRTFAGILRKCGLPPRNFHALRHTFATRALETGMDVRTLCELLGHRSPTVTLGRYSHSLPPHKAEMMQRLGALLEAKQEG